MIDLNIIAILTGIVCFLAGVGFGFPIGHRLHYWQMRRRTDRARAERADQERAARLEQVRERAFARVNNARETCDNTHPTCSGPTQIESVYGNRESYGILEAKDLS